MLKYVGMDRFFPGWRLRKGALYSVCLPSQPFNDLNLEWFAVRVSDGFKGAYITYGSLEDLIRDWEVAECCDS